MADIGGFALALGSIAAVDQALKVVLLVALPSGRVLRLGSRVRVAPLRSTGTFASRVGVPIAVVGAAWALLAGVALMSLSVVPAFEPAAVRVAVGVALGGAASNAIDQLVRGGVVDYIDLRVWPVFNLADVAIVVGAAVTVAAALSGASS